MANNRDSSKQKRARQNRAQREAREARAKAASVPAEERKAKYASGAPDAASTRSGRGSERARPARKPRPGDRPVDVESLEGNWFQRRMAVPGGSQVLMGLALVIIVTVMSFVVKLPAVKATKDRKALPAETLLDRIGPMALVLIFGALAIGLAAAHFALSPRRRQIWLWAAVLCFPAGFFGFAVYRARKVEGPAPGSRAARALAAREEKAVEGDDPAPEAARAAADDDQ